MIDRGSTSDAASAPEPAGAVSSAVEAPIIEPSVDDVFDMLADRTRREILALLRVEGRLSASVIAAAFPYLSRTGVSTKITQLRRAGLVVEAREGAFRFYSLAPVRPTAAIEAFLHIWS